MLVNSLDKKLMLKLTVGKEDVRLLRAISQRENENARFLKFLQMPMEQVQIVKLIYRGGRQIELQDEEPLDIFICLQLFNYYIPKW